MEYNVISYLKNSYENYPERIACADDTEEITYGELWHKSDAVASALIKLSCNNKPIPIISKKSCKTLVVIWGIIKSGTCYVMIDPMLPEERINSILKVLDADIAIACSSSKQFSGVEIIEYDNIIDSDVDVEILERQRNAICDVDPVYIMFTSGSTGIPKGVVVAHRSVMDFIDCFTDIFHITNQDVIGNQAPWDFDVSVKDIYSAAKVGAKIQIIAPKYFSFPKQLIDLLEEEKVTTLIWAVSALCIVSSRGGFDYRRPSCINKVIFSGEVMPTKQYNIWRTCYPEALFANVYGPTEITCNCTYAILDGEYRDDEALPIGIPFPNEHVYLIDDGNLITDEQVGKLGEICVSGTALALGYYNSSVESEKHFVQNPFIHQYAAKIYRTGDLGYYGDDGKLYFASRKDFQIKHMGHRIELSEIERAVNRLDEVSVNCCIYYEDEIVDFVVGNIEGREIQRELRKTLPVYMIPNRFVIKDSLPLNSHGKIDRKELVWGLEKGNYDEK